MKRTRHRMRWLAVLALAASLGCAQPPPRKPASLFLEAPATWQAEATAGSLQTAWWTQFADTHLDSLIAEALLHNHDLRAAVARIDAARAQVGITRSQALPQIQAGGSGAAEQRSLIGFPLPPGADATARADRVGVSLDTSWEVDVWGRVRSAESASLADAQALWAEAHGVRLSIAGQTAKAWFAVLESRAQVELARRTLRTFELSTQRVRERFEQGVRTPLELRLALSNEAAAAALLEQRLVQRDRAIRQLHILLGRYPTDQHHESDTLPRLQGTVPATSPVQLLEHRPDLVAAERRLAAAGARVSEARRAFLPQVRVSAALGRQGENPGDLFRADAFVWNVLGSLMQPIFQGGRLRAALALAQAGNEELLERYASRILLAWFEVETAYASERILLREMQAMESAARHAVAAQELAEDQYRNGLIDFITLLESQRRALDFQSRLLDVRRRRLDTRVNLVLALGGGFRLPAGADPSQHDRLGVRAADAERRPVDTPQPEGEK